MSSMNALLPNIEIFYALFLPLITSNWHLPVPIGDTDTYKLPFQCIQLYVSLYIDMDDNTLAFALLQYTRCLYLNMIYELPIVKRMMNFLPILRVFTFRTWIINHCRVLKYKIQRLAVYFIWQCWNYSFKGR